MSIKIQQVGEKQKEQLAALMNSFHDESFSHRSRKHSFERYVQLVEAAIKNPVFFAWIAIDERALGYIACTQKFSVFCGGPCVQIDEVFTLPDARRDGIGGKLIETVIGFCDSEGVSRVDLVSIETPNSMFPTSWYKNMGFELVGPSLRKNL